MSKSSQVNEIREKDTVRFGRIIPGRVLDGVQATITKGVSITLVSAKHGTRTFNIGDFAEYDSYNYAYTGAIVAIGEKTITIDKGHGRGNVRLSLHAFAWRNEDYDADAIASRNFEVSNHI